jgi:hypothetical protein
MSFLDVFENLIESAGGLQSPTIDAIADTGRCGKTFNSLALSTLWAYFRQGIVSVCDRE